MQSDILTVIGSHPEPLMREVDAALKVSLGLS